MKTLKQTSILKKNLYSSDALSGTVLDRQTDDR